LLQTAICPVDAVEVTVVPTLIRYGEKPSATAYLDQAVRRDSAESGQAEPRTEPVPVEQLAGYVSEAGNPKNWRGLRSVEVRLPRKMLVLFGVASALLGVVVAAPLTALIAAGIGQKIIREEKKRQIAYRRQQAQLAARRYVEEVSFVMNKEGRDALRRTQRLVRDDFQGRATSLHLSSASAVQAARRAMTLSGPGRAQRVSQLATEADQLDQVSRRVTQLMADLPSTGAA
jgi:hypothetical protein